MNTSDDSTAPPERHEKPRPIARRSFLVKAGVVAAGGLTVGTGYMLNKLIGLRLHAEAPWKIRDVLGLQEYPVDPYISKAEHLDSLPWPKQSFYKQPWRSFLETVPAVQFLSGIGINYNLPTDANHDATIKLLADSGFRSVRVEVGWSNVNWNEDTLTNGAKLDRILAACKAHGVVPLILLNAHHGNPGPNKAYQRTILAGGEVGSRTVRLNSVEDLVPGYSGISNLTGNWMNEAIFTKIDARTNTVELSKPLPKAIASNEQVPINSLRYLPFYPVGTRQFELTASGWLKYVQLVLSALKRSGFDDFEVEIWNELTFGSNYLSINHYYEPAVASSKSDFLKPGGQAWELAQRTIRVVKANHPTARVIWGFSNTTFHHTPVSELPAGIDGQSYHPYGTGRKVVPKDFPPKSRYDWFVEKFIPQGLSWSMPEGWAHLGVQTENLMRLLNPVVRKASAPPKTNGFVHYMTEHGFNPKEVGITDRDSALTHKAKSLIRALPFWLNKGVTKVMIFAAHGKDDLGMGMLLSQPLTRDSGVQSSPALRALRNVARKFDGAQSLGQMRSLDLQVTSLGRQYKVFDGNDTHPPLYYRELFTFLPFQVHARKFVCAVYVMSYDVTNPPPAMDFRLTVRNIKGDGARVSFYDPLTDRELSVRESKPTSDGLSMIIEAVEYPRLLTIED